MIATVLNRPWRCNEERIDDKERDLDKHVFSTSSGMKKGIIS